MAAARGLPDDSRSLAAIACSYSTHCLNRRRFTGTVVPAAPAEVTRAASFADLKRIIFARAGASADYTGQGRLTVNTLDLYISERVKELTAGNQTPTTAKLLTVPDFPVALKR